MVKNVLVEYWEYMGREVLPYTEKPAEVLREVVHYSNEVKEVKHVRRTSLPLPLPKVKTKRFEYKKV